MDHRSRGGVAAIELNSSIEQKRRQAQRELEQGKAPTARCCTTASGLDGAPAPPVAASIPATSMASSAASTSAAAATVSRAAVSTTAAVGATTPTAAPVVIKPGMPPVRLLVHFSGQTLDALQKQVIDPFNNGPGAQNKIQVTVEHVPDAQEFENMVADKLGGDPPDIYHTPTSVKVLAQRQLANPLPANEQTCVKQNYYPSPVNRLTYQGKVYGYPSAYHALGYMYRKSYFKQMGITDPPKTTDEEFEYAQKLTQKQGSTVTRIGFTIFQGRLGQNFVTWIARFGGQMYTFDGDHPTKIDVASPQAIDAVSYWKKLVEAGATEGATADAKAWQNSQAASGEIEAWFPLLSIRDPGKLDVFNDLGASTVPPAPGVKAIWYFYGYGLVPATGVKHPDEAQLALSAFMHQPAMPYSRFIVENNGSPPVPLNYPMPIPNWTPDLIRAYAVEAVKTALPDPEELVLGVDELQKAYGATITDILANKVSVRSGVAALNPPLNDILKRTDS